MATRNLVRDGSHDSFSSLAPLALWTLGWIATLALARFGPGHLWDADPVASWIALAGNLAVGLGLIATHVRYLRNLDELQRKIMVDAMAVTLGATLVAGCAYAAAAQSDLIGEASIGVLVILMAVVYMIAIFSGNARYR